MEPRGIGSRKPWFIAEPARRSMGPPQHGPTAAWAHRSLGPTQHGPTAAWAHSDLAIARLLILSILYSLMLYSLMHGIVARTDPFEHCLE